MIKVKNISRKVKPIPLQMKTMERKNGINQGALSLIDELQGNTG